MIVAGLNVNLSDVYKPHGYKEKCALLREAVFVLLIISAPPSLIPWLYTTIFPFAAIPGLKLFFDN